MIGIQSHDRRGQCDERRGRCNGGCYEESDWKVPERYDSGDRRLASDDIKWETNYWKLLKQYNELTIALVKQLKEDNEDMKEVDKNMFQGYKEFVPCIEENNICEIQGLKKRLKEKQI